MKNILPHIVIYEKTTLDKNIIWDVQHDVRQISKNLQILRSKKAYGLKISQSIIFMFFSTLKDIIQVQSKTNHRIS